MNDSAQAALRRGKELLADREARWSSTVRLSANPEDSLYNVYPYLFRDAFPAVGDGTLEQLSLASRLFSGGIVILDDIIDAHELRDDVSAAVRRSIAMHFEAYREIARLFPPENPFWDALQKNLTDYFRGCILEEVYGRGGGLAELDATRAVNIIKYKTAPTRAVLAGLAMLSGDQRTAAELTLALDDYNVARQLLDDLQDWREDVLTGRATLVIAHLFACWPSAAELDAGAAHRLYYDGHAARILELASHHARASLARLEAFPVRLPVVRVVEATVAAARTLHDDIGQISAEAIARRRSASYALPFAERNISAPRAISGALDFLLRQWTLGFGEARHLMRFPSELGFTTTGELQRGDIFQRSVVLESVLDARDRFGFDADDYVASEIDYLVNAREREGIGGWSYFAGIWDLAPDADDLAQMIQLFTRLGRKSDVAEYCAPALRCLLEDNARPDGSFETFIVPARDHTDRERAQAHANAVAWGRGGDPDVVANVLYALARYDPQVYAGTIAAGVRYVIAQQRDGSWESTWYHDRYYGTYVALRLLDVVGAGRESRDEAARFLRTSRNPDGGWGSGGTSNELQTALALLALSYTGPSEGGDTLIAGGTAYLADRALGPDAFAATHYIRMDYGRARNLPDRVMYYGSRTMTAAFVLRALTRCHALTAIAEKAGAA